MKSTSPDVVQIGVGPACVTRVTPQQIDFIDETGQERSIDLEDCAQNWIKLVDKRDGLEEKNRKDPVARPVIVSGCITEWDASCVGVRNLLDGPPWVRFMNERHTRFEFKSYDESYALLLGPLGRAGWHTFDEG